MVNWIAIIISGMTTFFVLVALLKTNILSSVLDRPNHRSLHAVPIPRSGGLAIMMGVLVALLANWLPDNALIIGLSLLLVAISFLDDLGNISVIWRFLTHFAAAAIFVVASFPHSIGLLEGVFLVLAIVWVTNLFNFMDGSDGLAGGMAFFGFGFYGIAAWVHGDTVFSSLNGGIMGSALAFLCFNFHPARVFMGDAGSIPLGFLAAVFGLLGWMNGVWPLWFPPLIFAPFIADASITLTKRIFAREKVWQAHRSHYYQRLVLMGWGHGRTAVAEYMLMAITGATAVLLLEQPGYIQGCGLLLWGVVYGVLMLWVDAQWRHQKPRQSDVASAI